MTNTSAYKIKTVVTSKTVPSMQPITNFKRASSSSGVNLFFTELLSPLRGCLFPKLDRIRASFLYKPHLPCILVDCILPSPNFLGLDMGSDNHRHIRKKASLLKGITQKIIFSHKDYNLESVNLTKFLNLFNKTNINIKLNGHIRITTNSALRSAKYCHVISVFL